MWASVFGGNEDSSKFPVGETQLCAAVVRGDAEAVAQLLEAHADVNQVRRHMIDERPMSREMQTSGVLPIMQSLHSQLQKNTGETPLYLAAERGNAIIVAQLIMAGAKINRGVFTVDKNSIGNTIERCNVTPLYIAVEKGYTGIVAQLIEAQADVNLEKYNTCQTPIFAAVERDHTEIVAQLLEAHSYVNHTREVRSIGGRESPLHVAIERGNADIVAQLIRAGAKVECRKGNLTPLYIAAGKGNINIVAQLIEAGADVNQEIVISDEYGEVEARYTALSVATNHEVVALLQNVPSNQGRLRL